MGLRYVNCLHESRYQSLGSSKSRAWGPALDAGSLLGRWFLGVSLGRENSQWMHTHGWISSWMMGLSPTGDPLRNCMESTQDWPACVMRCVATESLMSLHFHIPPACRGHSPGCWEGSPARKQRCRCWRWDTGHLLWLQNSGGLWVQSEAPAASVPGCIETEGAPNQWSFETSCSM